MKSIIVEQMFEATIETVWKSITEIEQMRQWYFENIPSFKAEIGFETQFNINSGGRDFLHMWKVTEVVPLKRIAYSWKYESCTGDSFVIFELQKHDNYTKLTLTHTVLENFPDDIPEFNKESCRAGWEFFIKQSLKKYLEKTD